MGGRGLKSVETQYKMTKVKTAVKLYTNQDSTMELVRQFDEKCERDGRRSIVKDAKKYAEEMGLELGLSPGAVVTTTHSNEDISSEKYHNTKASAFWDVPVFAGNTEVRANRIDVRIVEKETETVKIIEMSCPWIENRKQKNQEKTTKYAPLR
ncbi:unnamed protein product [Pocillopora meandrina]|uniref:Uncharacterized protein n=1 Tax=Pocillopora meandrina TaxID=46732 RepID=A0AAU9VKU0_9CNID|nr:unnamed protein product [Pocillopora meandrina]